GRAGRVVDVGAITDLGRLDHVIAAGGALVRVEATIAAASELARVESGRRAIGAAEVGSVTLFFVVDDAVAAARFIEHASVRLYRRRVTAGAAVGSHEE